MIARLVIRLAVLLRIVGMKLVSRSSEVERDSSEINLKPIFRWIVIMELFAASSIASGFSRKALILGLIRVILRKIGIPRMSK